MEQDVGPQALKKRASLGRKIFGVGAVLVPATWVALVVQRMRSESDPVDLPPMLMREIVEVSGDKSINFRIMSASLTRTEITDAFPEPATSTVWMGSGQSNQNTFRVIINYADRLEVGDEFPNTAVYTVECAVLERAAAEEILKRSSWRLSQSLSDVSKSRSRN